MNRETSGRGVPKLALPAPMVEPTARWIRVKFGHEYVADSRRALLLIEYGPGRLPTYYFPMEDVRMDLLEAQPSARRDPEFTYYTVKAGDQVVTDAAWMHRDPKGELSALKGYITFSWDKSGTWYEEDLELFAHARDPHKRVDAVPSSRYVRVVIGGTTVAETHHPTLLFETPLPTRYYIPREDVRMDLLEPSTATTQCPYKGTAEYWTFKVGDQVMRNVVWSYPDPIPECPRIKGMLCFFNERVDLYVDGELQERPLTPWSN